MKNSKPDLRALINQAGGIPAVAHAVGVREASIYNWLMQWKEHHRLSRISAENAFRLADAIGCDAKVLVEE